MNSRREQALVGIFVLIAVALLVGTVLAVSGTFGKKGVTHRAYFKYAGGLVSAAPVRYGGFLAGRIESLRVDPQDSTRIEIDFTTRDEIPVKTDSVAKITSLGALGESYLEVTTGTKDAPLAPPGTVLRSQEMVGIGDLADRINTLIPTANEVMQNLNNRLVEMKVTLAEVNDVLGDKNRKNISDGLGTLNGMLAETRPKLAKTLDNVQTASNRFEPVMKNVQTATDQIAPLLDDFKKTIKQANDALAHIDAVVVENRPDIRAAMTEIRKTLATASEVVEILRNTLDRNTDNLDETLSNIRNASENMRQLTDTLNRHPSVLLHGETGKDRKPGGKK
jgi:phospholipid/cholesterol/gamma-HCH transport system substrate-binding protein